MTTAAVPELWTDWCSVVGVPVESVDEPTLTRFSQQARSSEALFSRLCEHRDNLPSLQRLVARADVKSKAGRPAGRGGG